MSNTKTIIATEHNHQRAAVREALESRGYDVEYGTDDDTEMVLVGGVSSQEETKRECHAIMSALSMPRIWLDGELLLRVVG